LGLIPACACKRRRSCRNVATPGAATFQDRAAARVQQGHAGRGPHECVLSELSQQRSCEVVPACGGRCCRWRCRKRLAELLARGCSRSAPSQVAGAGVPVCASAAARGASAIRRTFTVRVLAFGAIPRVVINRGTGMIRCCRSWCCGRWLNCRRSSAWRSVPSERWLSNSFRDVSALPRANLYAMPCLRTHQCSPRRIRRAQRQLIRAPSRGCAVAPRRSPAAHAQVLRGRVTLESCWCLGAVARCTRSLSLATKNRRSESAALFPLLLAVALNGGDAKSVNACDHGLTAP
jgi:hypothetical protein